MSGMWLLRLQPVPKVSKKLIINLAPVALFHTIAHVSACVSFSKMAVSFTHVIKVRNLSLSLFFSFLSSVLCLKAFVLTDKNDVLLFRLLSQSSRLFLHLCSWVSLSPA